MNQDSEKSENRRKKTVFHFLDYRKYLACLYEQLLDEDMTFSYRAFARLANSSSPNFLQMVTSGKLRMTDKQTHALTESIGMRQKEALYLKALVDFDHAECHDSKNQAFRQIVKLRAKRIVNHIADYQYDYLSNWYNPVIRELVSSEKYPDDPSWIAKRIVPELGVRDVKNSINLLKKFGLIVRNESDTGWDVVDKTITTPTEVLSISVVEYHRQMLTLASESLERFPGTMRDLRSVTLSISKDQFPELKERMTTFWNEMLEFADSADDCEMVVQINTQLFPFVLPEEDDQ